MHAEPLFLQLLSRLERIEAQLLSWGVIDGAFTWSELLHQASEVTRENGSSGPQPDELIQELRARQLVMRVADQRDRYRTRMAETLRLIATLRQIFSDAPDAWRSAPTLVADFRFALRERSYPVRDIAPDDLIDALQAAGQLPAPARVPLTRLLDRGDSFQAAGFQQRACVAAIEALKESRSSGVVVASGTGSGKTLAFYLPALSWVASVLGPERWTKVLTLYPRNELLKDQIRTAYSECRRLDGRGPRKITIGAFFGPTPFTPSAVSSSKDWRRVRSGWVCPFLACPHCEDGELVWLEEDVRQEHERLHCNRANCGHVVSGDEVILTRRRMQQEPPDVLFTTTETLNRRMSDDWSRKVFGLGQPVNRRPRFLLLDEVHVNTGTSGAQTALLVRRWRNEVDAPVVLFGLSATLLDAAGYFADLVGLPRNSVVEVSPYEQELIAEGMEYSLAVRGDPASGTALLSTTIQATFLLERMLDSGSAVSSGVYGQRLYAFTDKLDVVNRLYWNLANAEGWDNSGLLRRTPRSLAALRSPARPTANAVLQSQAGQRWNASVDIGWSLDDDSQLIVGRTSSQDSGVTKSADVVVATASLEVGYDDALAGAVVQHKAPRGAAQFLQRKGRAGRVRGMRPWTMTVLSDYGMDRLAYQSYDRLFDPELSRQALPLGNRHVLKQQAGFALFEWLGDMMRTGPKGHLWRDAQQPATQTFGQERQQHLHDLVQRILTEEAMQEALTQQLSRRLYLSMDEARALLWEPPRAIMTEFLPTLNRRLQSGWKTLSGTDAVSRGPLPEFLPAALFNDLLVPEVTMDIPAPGRGQSGSQEAMGVVQALTEFCPGRVSRRFAVEHSRQRHWLPIDVTPTSGPTTVSLVPHVTGDLLGTVSYHDQSGTLRQLPCLRPLQMNLENLPDSVRDTSSAQPEWQWQFTPTGTPVAAPIPEPSPWRRILDRVDFHLNVRDSPTTICRFYEEVVSDTKFTDGQTQSQRLQFVRSEEGSEPMALGFEMDVDALAITVNRSAVLSDLESMPEAARRTHRTERFRDALRHDRDLPLAISIFQRDWLAWLAECGIAESLHDALDRDEAETTPIDYVELQQRMLQALEVVVGTATSIEHAEEVVDPDEQGRLFTALLDLLHDPHVISRVTANMRLLSVDPTDPDELAWAFERYRSTLAAAMIDAMGRLNPQLDLEALIPDLSAGSTESSAPRDDQVWISEVVPGGAGILERFYADYCQDPRRYWDLVASALQARDYEVVDSELSRIVALDPASPVRQAMAAVRVALSAGNEPLVRAQRDVRVALADGGHQGTHAVLSAIHNRLLKPGSSIDTDTLLAMTVAEWNRLEAVCGFDIDTRTMAYLKGKNEPLTGIPAQATSGSPEQRQQQRFSLMQSLLWIRGGMARALSLAGSNRYRRLPTTDRLLVSHSVEQHTPAVAITEPDWKAQLTAAINASGRGHLSCPSEDVGQLSRAVMEILESGIEVGFLTLYPRLAGVSRDADTWTATLDLREAPQ